MQQLVPVTFPVLRMERLVSTSVRRCEGLTGDHAVGAVFVALTRPLTPNCQRSNDSKNAMRVCEEGTWPGNVTATAELGCDPGRASRSGSQLFVGADEDQAPS